MDQNRLMYEQHVTRGRGIRSLGRRERPGQLVTYMTGSP